MRTPSERASKQNGGEPRSQHLNAKEARGSGAAPRQPRDERLTPLAPSALPSPLQGNPTPAMTFSLFYQRACRPRLAPTAVPSQLSLVCAGARPPASVEGKDGAEPEQSDELSTAQVVEAVGKGEITDATLVYVEGSDVCLAVAPRLRRPSICRQLFTPARLTFICSSRPSTRC